VPLKRPRAGPWALRRSGAHPLLRPLLPSRSAVHLRLLPRDSRLPGRSVGQVKQQHSGSTPTPHEEDGQHEVDQQVALWRRAARARPQLQELQRLQARTARLTPWACRS